MRSDTGSDQRLALRAGTAQFRDDPEAALAGYRENDFHIEYGVWSEPDCEHLLQLADTFPGRARDDYRPLMNPHRKVPIFLGYVGKPEIVRVIKHLIGEPISALQSTFYFGAPGTRGFARHQDNFFVETDASGFASAWSALTDISPENGGLYLYPGSHREPRIPVSPLEEGPGPNQDPNARNEEVLVPAGYAPLSVSVPRGTAVFLHANLIHGSHTNSSNKFRWVLLSTYIHSGEKFRPGRTAGRTEMPLG